MRLKFSNSVFWSDRKHERNNNQIPLEPKHGHTLLSQLLLGTLDPGFRRGDGQALPLISVNSGRSIGWLELI